MNARAEVADGSRPTRQRQAGFVTAVRVHNALTAAIEKRFLTWMAHRTPQAIGPDHLTALAFVCQILAGVAYALSAHEARFLWLVNLFLFFNWLGDSLDGTLARVRNRQRPRYGFYVDHIADTFGALAMMAGLGLSGFLHWKIAAGMLVCFYALSIESYLATYTTGRFQLSHGLFGPTEIRILLAAGNAWVIAHPYLSLAGWQVRLFDFGGLAAIVGMGAMVLSAAVRRTVHLYREESLP